MVALTTWPTYDTNATEDRWEKMLRTWYDDGVVPYPASGMFRVYADSSGMTVKVAGNSFSMLRGFFTESEDIELVPVDNANGSFARKDIVVLRLTTGGDSAGVELDIVAGTAQASPLDPALDNTDTVLEFPLARITLPAGAITVRAQDVVDLRTYSAPKITDQVGVVKMLYGSVAPPGYLTMIGQTVNTADFPVLARYWGLESFTTMVIPDMRGSFVRGATGAIGATGGADTLTLSTANLPAHAHGLSSGGWTGGGHAHSFTSDPHQHAISQNAHSHGITQTPHSHSITDNGHHHDMDGDPGNRFVVTASGFQAQSLGGPVSGGGVSFSDVDTAGTSILINGDYANVGVNAAMADVGVQNATVTGTIGNSGALSGSLTGSTDQTGSASAFSILPKYRSLTYIIKAH